MSLWDIEQKKYLNKKNPNLYTISFRTKHHGIPFLKVALSNVINLSISQLEMLAKKSQSPIRFTIQMVGIKKTLLGIFKQMKQAYYKRR